MKATVEGLSELSDCELEDELATLASHLYAGTCRWLELVCEVDRRGGWATEGRSSCAEWLAWRCALTPRAPASTCAWRAGWGTCL